MAQKFFLEELEIQSLEEMTEEEMAELPASDLANILKRFTHSYRMAARVTNAAKQFWWALTDPNCVVTTQQAEEELTAALAGFYPGYVYPPNSQLALVVQILGELYEQAPIGTPEQMVGMIFARLEYYGKQVQ